MFALRIIIETRKDESKPFEQVIENHELGNSYAKLKKGVTSEFDQIMDDKYPENDKSEINGLLCGENGTEFFICENKPNETFTYFVMSESGKTFERL